MVKLIPDCFIYCTVAQQKAVQCSEKIQSKKLSAVIDEANYNVGIFISKLYICDRKTKNDSNKHWNLFCGKI